MPSPRKLDIGLWNDMVQSFHGESDRGAAILASSFTEHSLGQYLKFRIGDKKVADALFAPLGPLASFSQRIAIAYAFEIISEAKYEDFENVRRVRNHFAHHPLDTTFATHEIQQLTGKLSMHNVITEDQYPDRALRHRTGYLLTCGVLCATMLSEIEKKQSRAD